MTTSTTESPARLFARIDLEKHRHRLLFSERRSLDRGDLEPVTRALLRRARWSLVGSLMLIGYFLWIGVLMPVSFEGWRPAMLIVPTLWCGTVVVLWTWPARARLREMRELIGTLDRGYSSPPLEPIEFVHRELTKHRRYLRFAERKALEAGDLESPARAIRCRARWSAVFSLIVVAYLFAIVIAMLVTVPEFDLKFIAMAAFNSALYLALGVLVVTLWTKRALRAGASARAVLSVLTDVRLEPPPLPD